MYFVSMIVILALSISGIKAEAEHLTGPLGGPLPGPGVYKDGHHDYLQAFHHGQHHVVNTGSESGSSGTTVGGHSVLNPQIQDQTSVISPDQISSQSNVGGGPIVGGSIIPQFGVSYIPQKSELPLHFGAGSRAIGSPLPYYPYYGKTYASPYYSQYQPSSPYQGIYSQPYYPYQYSASPYPALPYSATPYSSPGSSYPGHPYNNGYFPQYNYPGYPSPSYYQSSGEVQTVSKQ